MHSGIIVKLFLDRSKSITLANQVKTVGRNSSNKLLLGSLITFRFEHTMESSCFGNKQPSASMQLDFEMKMAFLLCQCPSNQYLLYFASLLVLQENSGDSYKKKVQILEEMSALWVENSLTHCSSELSIFSVFPEVQLNCES